MKLGVAAVGVIGPDMENWQQAAHWLRESQGYDVSLPLPKLAPSLLPANERRRTTRLIKLALQCGQDALTQWDGDVQQLATVFASSCGDLEMVDKILSTLNLPGKPVSPTHFHNSVHNAPAGYWSIAAKAQAPSNSLSAYDGSFAAGLLEAGTQVICDECPVMLVAYDIPPPPALWPFRPLPAAFSTALLLVPSGSSGVQAELNIALNTAAQPAFDDAALLPLFHGNPAARALPLLRQLALQLAGGVTVPYLPDTDLQIEVQPC